MSMYVGSNAHAPTPVVPHHPQPTVPADSIVVKKESLLAFMVDVVYATGATKGKDKELSRSDIMRAVVEAAGRFLGTGACDPLELHKFMTDCQKKATKPQDKEVEGIVVNTWEGNDD
ncbi:Hypothetical predicted protein [Xyrichtys novacula]|uniref:Uncharacterized protein n=1 Tax=Xyrichtys novacula TaxID=13765 RepID=A0AAV1HM68_XYRNO|nr:Hypothetical predicted protein [Xyrichtys novacula]